ncbi:MAG: hypothetical protein GF410_06035 [Chitinivibrionales bacterium]|nr:hypothetical protein [Chitinivibrionales bacterium]
MRTFAISLILTVGTVAYAMNDSTGIIPDSIAAFDLLYLGMQMDKVLSIAGTRDSLTTVPAQCAEHGPSKLHFFPGLKIETDTTCRVVQSIQVTSSRYKSIAGVAVSDSLERIFKVYGYTQPSYETESDTIWEYYTYSGQKKIMLFKVRHGGTIETMWLRWLP